MYTMKFKYSGSHYQDYAHIEKVEYNSGAGIVSVTGDNILSQEYPLDYDLHLFAELKSYKVPHNCLKAIEITKENS